MPHKIQITEEANLDTINAVDYYSSINNDLADKFEKELYATYAKVSNNPQFYKFLTKGKKRKFRCSRLKSFPYLVIYRIDKQTIIIIAVFNTHQNPVYGLP